MASARKSASVETFGKAIARQLSRIREQRGTTQHDLAEATKISQSQLSKQLRGLRAINIDELASICDALEVSMLEVIRKAEETNRIASHSNVVRLPSSQVGVPFRAVADGSDYHDEENSEFDD